MSGPNLFRLFVQDEASESRMRMASLIEQAQAAHDRRSALYQSYEDAINKFKSSKDATTFKANQKKIDADHKQLTAQITGLQLKLKTEGADASEKVFIFIFDRCLYTVHSNRVSRVGKVQGIDPEFDEPNSQKVRINFSTI